MGRKRKPVELPATAKAKVGPHALGRGSHASACVKVMISNVYTGLMHFLLKKVGVLEHGPKWGEVIADVGSHPLRTLVAKLMHVSTDTVRRAVCKVKGASWWDNHTSHNRQLDPKKRGPNEKTVEEKRADWCFIYDVLCDKITQCRRDGDTMTIHQVAVFLMETFGPTHDEDTTDWTYAQARYCLMRLGFDFGRISRTLYSGREEKVAWLKGYCARRVASIEEKSLSVVEIYIDEVWMYQSASSQWSWFLDNRTWAKGRGITNKWGCIVALYSWWELDASGEYVQKAMLDQLNVSTWMCRDLKEGEDVPLYADFCHNICGEDFEAFLQTVCENAAAKFPTRRSRFHYDNAGFHKRKNTEVPDLSTATKHDLVSWLVLNADIESGIGGYDSFLNANGNIDMSLSALKALVKGQRRYDPLIARAIVREHGNKIGDEVSEVDHQAPLWPQTQPCELLFNNMKWDYRSWPTVQKSRDVGRSMQTFMQQVPPEECLRFVQKTDTFCKAIVDQDASKLDELVIELL